ncbi:hypothetical protein JB92DRAFT_2837178 [Gautieria morchelliformis]|nr:hypothetical protein JB92DRAFT_2837178 [Gautieria morchelliformis]
MECFYTPDHAVFHSVLEPVPEADSGHAIQKHVGGGLMEPEAWVRVGRATAWIRWAGSALVHVPVRVGSGARSRPRAGAYVRCTGRLSAWLQVEDADRAESVEERLWFGVWPCGRRRQRQEDGDEWG